jgi:hypothetical protein
MITQKIALQKVLQKHCNHDAKVTFVGKGWCIRILMNGIPSTEYLDYWETPADFEPDWNTIEAIANS